MMQRDLVEAGEKRGEKRGGVPGRGCCTKAPGRYL